MPTHSFVDCFPVHKIPAGRGLYRAYKGAVPLHSFLLTAPLFPWVAHVGVCRSSPERDKGHTALRSSCIWEGGGRHGSYRAALPFQPVRSPRSPRDLCSLAHFVFYPPF